MIFSGRTRTQSAGNVFTHLTSRDGVPHVRPEKQSALRESENAGTGFKEGGQVFLVRSETKTRCQKTI